MTRNTYLVLFLLLGLSNSFLYAQNTQNDLISKPVDTTYSKDFDAYYFDLQPVDSSNFKYHVRIPAQSMIFDFYGNDSLKMQGRVVNYIYQDKNKYDKKGVKIAQLEENILSQITPLSDSIVQSYMKIFYASNILKISLDTLERQANNLHCGTMSFYVKNNDIYRKYSMICPNAKKDTIFYRDIFINNYNALLSSFPYQTYFEKFKNAWPIEYEYSDGYLNYAVDISIFPKPYQRKLKREYSKSQKKISK